MADEQKSKGWLARCRELVGGRKRQEAQLKKARAKLVEDRDGLQRRHIELQVLNGARAVDLVDDLLEVGRRVEAARAWEDPLIFGNASREIELLGLRMKKALEDEKALVKKLLAFDTESTRLQSKLAGAAGLRDATRPGSEVQRSLQAARALHAEALTARNLAARLAAGSDIEQAMAGLAAVVRQLKDTAGLAAAADERAGEYPKAMSEWAEVRPMVLAAVRMLGDLPGAEKEHRILLNRYNEALAAVRQVDGVWVGHDEALRKVALYEGVLKVGREASAAHMSESMPIEVSLALVRVETQLERLADTVPPAIVRSYRAGAHTLLESGRHQPAPAIVALEALAGKLRIEADGLVESKRQAEEAVRLYRARLLKLQTLGVPETLYAALRLSGDAAAENDIAQRQWLGVVARLRAVDAGLGTLEEEFATLGAAWQEKRGELARFRADAVGLIGFPALATGAMNLRDAVSEVQKSFAGGGRLQAAIDAFASARVAGVGLPAAHAALLQDALQKKVPLGKPEELTAYVDGLAAAGEDVYRATQKARGELRGWLDKQRGLEDGARATLLDSWFAELQAKWNEWLGFRKTATGDIAAVKKTAARLIEEVGKLVEGFTGLAADALLAGARKAVFERQSQDARSSPDETRSRIENARQAGVDVDDEQQALDSGSADYRDILVRLGRKEKALVEGQTRQRLEISGKVLTEIDEPLTKLQVSETYKTELRQQSTDIKWMLDSGDPELVVVAGEMQKKLVGHLDDIGDSGDAYAVNKKTMDRLAGFIGGFLIELPDTHQRLETRLTDLRLAARSVAPSVTTEELSKFEVEEVKAASTALRLRLAEVKGYREIKDRVRAKLKKVLAIGNAPQFEAHALARIADAKARKLLEGGVSGARNILLTLEVSLDDILNTPDKGNAKEKLKTANAAQMQEQRRVVDIASQYQQEASLFLTGVLPRARLATEGAEDGDSDLVEGLEDVVRTADRIVEPYLSLLTFFQIGSAPAPDMGKLKSDFDRARAMLADANRTAQRLIDSPSTTNVAGPLMGAKVAEGLARLRTRWTVRTAAFDQAVGEVSAAIRNAGAGESEAMVRNAETAATTIDGLRGLFRPDAFVSSFGQLEAPWPKEKSEQEAFRKRQVAAREAALLVMRQCHARLQNPLLLKLTDAGVNPFEPASIKVAAASISTVLKEIQLQALASV